MAAARVIAPEHCACCDAPVAPARVFCASCAPGELTKVAAPLETLDVHVAGAYEHPLSTAILRMKFGRRADIAYRLSMLLPSGVVPRGAIVVPVPLHLTRLCERGFNPAALIARDLARRSRASCAARLLERARATPHQSHLSARERRANVARAFRVRASSAHVAAGRHVVLVDDVVTTGATVRACGEALYAAGVVHVSVVALSATAAR